MKIVLRRSERPPVLGLNPVNDGAEAALSKIEKEQSNAQTLHSQLASAKGFWWKVVGYAPYEDRSNVLTLLR